jgi:hypothetical protein|tara:strand:+ start:49 stop:822 length:774 start_codon:yes stop_codon:yes gene_type:complete
MIHILDENQIAENYERFRKLINQTFEGERLEKLNKMYDQLEDRIILTPASSFEHFHNAFAGGYVDHVLRVTLNAVKTYEFQQDLGIDMSSLTKETVIFTALHHDLGKVGNDIDSWYIPNDSQWHVENQGKIYKTNPSMHWMNTNDRTFWLLNHFGVNCTEEEWISIKLTDGLYDDSNAEYLRKAFADQKLKTPLPHLMHQADLNACTFESQRLIKLKQGEVTTKNLGGRPTKKAKLENVKMPDKIDFKSIFGETEDV